MIFKPRYICVIAVCDFAINNICLCSVKTIPGNKVQETTINVGNFATGVYMIEISTDTNLKIVRKFIVN